jgi:hypothetical protein
MEQSPSLEADDLISADQEIYSFLMETEALFVTHNISPLHPSLNQLISVTGSKDFPPTLNFSV